MAVGERERGCITAGVLADRTGADNCPLSPPLPPEPSQPPGVAGFPFQILSHGGGGDTEKGRCEEGCRKKLNRGSLTNTSDNYSSTNV